MARMPARGNCQKMTSTNLGYLSTSGVTRRLSSFVSFRFVSYRLLLRRAESMFTREKSIHGGRTYFTHVCPYVCVYISGHPRFASPFFRYRAGKSEIRLAETVNEKLTIFNHVARGDCKTIFSFDKRQWRFIINLNLNKSEDLRNVLGEKCFLQTTAWLYIIYSSNI